MHTFIKYTDHLYTVGYWVVSGQKFVAVFQPLFDVDTSQHAVQAVSILNGGTGMSVPPYPFWPIKEYVGTVVMATD